MAATKSELVLARKAAQAGAQVVARQYGESRKARMKDDSKSLVTKTDSAAEAAILAVLAKGSSYSILSEESGLHRKGGGPSWIVDPLDGTTNFARELPLFSVSVALFVEGRPSLGVIVDPISNNEFYAAQGGGAFLNEKQLRLPAHHSDQPLTLFVNHGYAETDREKFAEVTRRFSSSCYLRKLGTTALELCYVATGAADGFICSGDQIWDFAAGVLIAQEAGCLFTDWKGEKWDGTSTFVLIARPEAHAALLEQIRDLQA